MDIDEGQSLQTLFETIAAKCGFTSGSTRKKFKAYLRGGEHRIEYYKRTIKQKDCHQLVTEY